MTNRIIDIRIWDKKQKKYWYNVLSEMGENQLYDDFDEEISMWWIGFLMETGKTHRGRFSFEQYVGKYNGKKVYVNDIVILNGTTEIGETKIKGVVRWSDERKRFSVFSKQNEYQEEQEYRLYKNDKLKIIGNIHEVRDV